MNRELQQMILDICRNGELSWTGNIFTASSNHLHVRMWVQTSYVLGTMQLDLNVSHGNKNIYKATSTIRKENVIHASAGIVDMLDAMQRDMLEIYNTLAERSHDQARDRMANDLTSKMAITEMKMVMQKTQNKNNGR